LQLRFFSNPKKVTINPGYVLSGYIDNNPLIIDNYNMSSNITNLNGDSGLSSKNSSNNPTMDTLLTTIKDPTLLKVGDKITGKIVFISKNQAVLDITNIGLGMVRGKELYNDEYISKLKVGEEVEAMLIGHDNELGYLELSFKAIGRDKTWAEVNDAFDQKLTLPAKIRDANRGGFLVRVSGVDGFLPASLLAPSHAIKVTSNSDEKSLINKMKDYVGQTFNVKLMSVNTGSDTVIVSEKAVSDEISQLKLQKYKVGDIVDGTIIGIVDFGVFVRFDEDLEGLVHISEISWKKVENPYKEHKIGQQVKVKIVDIDKDNKINLSIKQTLVNPWVEFCKGTQVGDVFKGTITKVAQYGAIAINESDIQGLCHISQITTDKINSVGQVVEHLKVGKTYDFTVLALEKNEKLLLTRLPIDVAQAIKVDEIKEVLEKVKAEEKVTPAEVAPVIVPIDEAIIE
jgi:small subunit ribosomal protein S1